jgi:TRAP-type uncharacterized transport system substrate-binding protein
MPSLKIWNQNTQQWVSIGPDPVNTFSTVKVNDVYLDADSPNDILNIVDGDHIKVLPNENFDSIVISVSDIGQLTQLLTDNKIDLVGAINEAMEKINSHGHTYKQISPSSTWVILHNLNRRPNVSIVDSGGSVVIGDVHYDNDNQITLSFTAAFSGEAYLN